MANWARRMHRRAATIGNVVTSCGHPATHPYPRRMEKVKFGVTLDQVCKPDLPGPLLVLILKLNKESPLKKDIFRAPGHQGNMKKLIHFLQNGRLVNIDNFSVYTIASVLKKFLRKLPGGIFGAEREERLFRMIDLESAEEQWNEIHELLTSMPVYAQHLLVLLFGTFRVIATSAERAQTGMTSEALGVSVAPSFFHSCVSDGKQAKMEDVLRFKTATRIMKYLIDNFGASNLFGREMYEYYSRITGRILKVDNEWIYAFRYPPETTASREEILEAQERLLQQEADIWGLAYNLRAVSMQEESRSTLGLVHVPELSAAVAMSSTSAAELSQPGPSGIGRTSTGAALKESHTRLSVSLEESDLFKTTSSSSSTSTTTSSSSSSSSSAAAGRNHQRRMTLDELKAINRYAESTKSLSYLPQVHERQTARMLTRSEWFLSVSPTPARLLMVPIEFEDPNGGRFGNGVAALRSESIKHRHAKEPVTVAGHGNHAKILVRRTSSKEKKLLRRSSSKSKKDKENGNKSMSVEALHVGVEKNGTPTAAAAQQVSLSSPSRVQALTRSVPELDCSESEAQSIPVTLAYKPRI